MTDDAIIVVPDIAQTSWEGMAPLATYRLKMGGDLSFLGRVMRMEVLWPMVAGRRVRAELRIDELP